MTPPFLSLCPKPGGLNIILQNLSDHLVNWILCATLTEIKYQCVIYVFMIDEQLLFPV